MISRTILSDDPQWYKDAVIYELHVKSFKDGSGDGMGDFRGLTEKIDYLEGLGITAVWLLPFYPSPLKDDGYDIADYFDVHPSYGTLKDFRAFLKEAHRRGIRVITELVLNHTSDQHIWFRKSRRARPGTFWREFYVWSDSPEKYRDARIIFKDFETSNWAWDPVAKAYYWHRFYSHQPDLNYDNPNVRKMMLRVMDFWFGMGVDGMRIDAIPYLFEREGTGCDSLPETFAFVKELRAHVDEKFRGRMLLAEANQWPEDAVAYFGSGDFCHMAFHFPLMPRIFMSLQMEDRFPIIDILEQTPAIPASCQWALFLRNHDELTLEMVTDEERDYMYRVYAKDMSARINLGIRRRLAPLMGNHRRKIEIMNILLLSLPGTPVIYYGDEIGMGDNHYLGDRNGVRTPMQWSPDRNAGFSRANPQKLCLPVIIDPEYHYEALNVENQERNFSSLLWWTKRVIAMRKRFSAFSRGGIEFVHSTNPKVISFIRSYGDVSILVVVNLSRFSQVADLDLASHAGMIPEEVFSRNDFPVITGSPYVLTLGFHDYFWFLLKRKEELLSAGSLRGLDPGYCIPGTWDRNFSERMKEKAEKEILPRYVMSAWWFEGKGRKVSDISIIENIPLVQDSWHVEMLIFTVGYTDGTPDTYLLPLSFAGGDQATDLIEKAPHAVAARLTCDASSGILFDSAWDPGFRTTLLSMIVKRRAFRGTAGSLCTGHPEKGLRHQLPEKGRETSSRVLGAGRSTVSILYEKSLVLKLYRKFDEGPNPDMEMVRFLTETSRFPYVPPFAGHLECKMPDSEPVTIGHLQGYVPNQGDAWSVSLDAVERYFETILSRRRELGESHRVPPSIVSVIATGIPPLMQEIIGGGPIVLASLLGRRTAELHLALSADTTDPAFAPEPFSMHYQRSIYQTMRSLAKRVLDQLKTGLQSLTENLREEAGEILLLEREILKHFQSLMDRKISAMRTRIHGDFHLGRVLWTGNDISFIDFEGEPDRALSERRIKRSPLRDVAGMIRSFHYAPYYVLLQRGLFRPQDISALEPWADLWYVYMSSAFIRSYLEMAEDAPFIPKEREDLELLLKLFVLEKAVYELGCEMNRQPDRIVIPMRGIRRVLKYRRERA